MKKCKLAAFLTTILVISVLLTTIALAASFSDTSIRPGQTWTLYSTNVTYEWLNEAQTNRVVHTWYKRTGNLVNMTPWKAMSSLCWHEYGQSDFSYTLENSWTVSTSTNFAGQFGGELGFGYSYSSGSSLTSNVNVNLPTGWVACCVKFRLKDFNVSVYSVDQHKDINGQWVNTDYTSTSNAYYGTRIDNKSIYPTKYIKWLPESSIGTTDYSN